MGGLKKFYRATNIKTGEVIDGSVWELADGIGVADKTIYSACQKNTLILHKWKVEVIRDIFEVKKHNHIPPELLEEWDKVTEVWREAYRRRASGANAG